jgi:hypothetical protein
MKDSGIQSSAVQIFLLFQPNEQPETPFRKAKGLFFCNYRNPEFRWRFSLITTNLEKSNDYGSGTGNAFSWMSEYESNH